MAEVLMVTESFLLSLGFGVSLFTPIANSKLTGEGFVKLATTVALVPLLFSTILYLVQNISLVMLLFITHNHHWETFLYFLSSTILLGIITYAMILGHYYLVVPKLTEKPLLVANVILWVILVLKIAHASYFTYDNFDFFTAGTSKGAGYTFNWLMLAMRGGWGYLVIGIMSIFNWKLVKIRSIQSATGMLYAMTFFVIIGELCAQYMYYKYGMFL